MLLTFDFCPYPCPVVLGWRDRVEEPAGQRAYCSPVKLVGRIPEGLQARPWARHRFRREFDPQTLTEGAAHREVQGEVSHGQEDPHPVPHTAAWPQSRGTARNTPFYPHFSRLPNPTQSSRYPPIWMGFLQSRQLLIKNTLKLRTLLQLSTRTSFKPYPSPLRTSNSSNDAVKSH